MTHSPKLSRRAFLSRTSTGLVIAPWVASGWLRAAPSARIRHASFGAMKAIMRQMQENSLERFLIITDNEVETSEET